MNTQHNPAEREIHHFDDAQPPGVPPLSTEEENLKEWENRPEREEEPESVSLHAMLDDAEALASAGHGTDEDYGWSGGGEE